MNSKIKESRFLSGGTFPDGQVHFRAWENLAKIANLLRLDNQGMPIQYTSTYTIYIYLYNIHLPIQYTSIYTIYNIHLPLQYTSIYTMHIYLSTIQYTYIYTIYNIYTYVLYNIQYTSILPILYREKFISIINAIRQSCEKYHW